MEEGSLRCDANVSIRPAGEDDARHQDRAEEHELVPLPRARDRGGDRAPGGDPARGRRGRAGDAPLRPADAARCRRCARRRRRTTTATSRSPTWCRWRRPRRCSSAPARALPELPARARSGFESELGLPPDTAKLLAFRSELGDFFEEALVGRRRRPEDARQLGHAGVRQRRRRRSRRRAREAVAMVSEKTVSAGRRAPGARRAGRGGRRPGGDRRVAGPGRPGGGRAGRDRRQGDRRERRRGREDQGRQGQGDRRDRRRGDAARPRAARTAARSSG